MATRRELKDRPQIEQVSPQAAIAGGEIEIRGRGLLKNERPKVSVAKAQAHVVVGSDSLLIVRVPEGVSARELKIGNGDQGVVSLPCEIGGQIVDSVHPVTNPVVNRAGTIFTTFSGSRGQKTPVAVFQIEKGGVAKPFITDLMNATGLVFDREGNLLISSRHEGTVYSAAPDGRLSVYVEGMGVATGIVFDSAGNLYVGDRSGTIFKISPSRQIFVFATLEPSLAAFHLAFGPDGFLYVSGPTTSSFEAIHRISPAGEAEIYYRGLGRPQGLAFDAQGRLYVAASLAGRKGIVRIGPDRSAQLFLSGPNIVGLAFGPSRSLVLATNSALYRLNMGIDGWPLL